MTDNSKGFTDPNGQWVEADVPVLKAHDPEVTSDLQPGVPDASDHQPTQELYTDEEGQPVLRDKEPSYVATATEKES